MLHVSLDDKNKLYLKKFNTASQVLAFAFDFLPDDVATSWVALLRLVVNKNTHSKGFQPIVLGEQMTFDLT